MRVLFASVFSTMFGKAGDVRDENRPAPRLRVELPSRGTSSLARESMGETPMPLANTPVSQSIKATSRYASGWINAD